MPAFGGRSQGSDIGALIGSIGAGLRNVRSGMDMRQAAEFAALQFEQLGTPRSAQMGKLLRANPRAAFIFAESFGGFGKMFQGEQTNSARRQLAGVVAGLPRSVEQQRTVPGRAAVPATPAVTRPGLAPHQAEELRALGIPGIDDAVGSVTVTPGSPGSPASPERTVSSRRPISPAEIRREIVARSLGIPGISPEDINALASGIAPDRRVDTLTNIAPRIRNIEEVMRVFRETGGDQAAALEVAEFRELGEGAIVEGGKVLKYDPSTKSLRAIPLPGTDAEAEALLTKVGAENKRNYEELKRQIGQHPDGKEGVLKTQGQRDFFESMDRRSSQQPSLTDSFIAGMLSAQSQPASQPAGTGDLTDPAIERLRAIGASQGR
jgi:hypothetical protein